MLLPREFDERLREFLGAWRERARLRRDLRRLDDELLARNLAEIGVGPGDLAAARGGSARDLGRMLRHFGVDRERLPPALRGALRDAERVCACCPETARCRRWLAGTSEGDAPRLFCPNAATLDELAAARRRR